MTTDVSDITYETVKQVPVEDLLSFYEKQGHETTRVSDKLQRMMDNTFCFVTARRDGQIVGMARGVTDGVLGRLAECKLDPAFQGPACVTRVDGRIEHDEHGIAREMATRVIAALQEYGVERIDALAYGTEVDFCEELGFHKLPGIVAMVLE
jgi:predicted N-acetyltransferase YhbS